MIEIKVITSSPNKTIKYLNHLNINIYNTYYKNRNLIIKINKKDLPKIEKIYHYKIIKNYGKDSIIIYIRNNILSIFYTSIILILIFIYTNFIIKINIITENTQLQSIISNELDEEGITKYSLSQKTNKLNKIKNNILNNNKDIIEWINIEKIGMTYEVNIEPRKTKNKTLEKEYCNVISTKDATITRIITHKGTELISLNDSVKKGSILISGDIIYNNETKKQVCANGIVYGKTWYTINIKIPLTQEIIKKENTKRYNILLAHNNKKYKLFKPRLTNFIEENKNIINIFGYKIYLQKEIKIKKETKKYTEKELNKLISKKIDESMSHTLNGEYTIVDRKVLKKQTNNSKIELEIFIVAEEQISIIDD